MEDKVLMILKRRNRVEVVGDELIELVKEFFQVSVKCLVTGDDEFCCYRREFDRNIPM